LPQFVDLGPQRSHFPVEMLQQFGHRLFLGRRLNGRELSGVDASEQLVDGVVGPVQRSGHADLQLVLVLAA
jgi:hypothetical protein